MGYEEAITAIVSELIGISLRCLILLCCYVVKVYITHLVQTENVPKVIEDGGSPTSDYTVAQM